MKGIFAASMMALAGLAVAGTPLQAAKLVIVAGGDRHHHKHHNDDDDVIILNGNKHHHRHHRDCKTVIQTKHHHTKIFQVCSDRDNDDDGDD